ncbi:thiaminase II [Paenibacillus massiliensis]|uniref:thiaminase II n=1 Tax=Paenibacillus massiliensis TaxID=225917 RepID=UPI00037D9454|nr:thiaminase II [Paenibacillus massiliensis]
MTITERLYQAAQPVWKECLQHPFVTGIGDGSLAVEQFRYYLLQDYSYLFEYARVFALGIVKSQDPKLMQFFSKKVDNILNGEMKIHRSYMQRLGITEDQVFQVQPALKNAAYTHYMLSVSHAGGVAEVLVSILACSWSYAEIGQALARKPGAADHAFYGEWIKGYASSEYNENNQSLVTLTDKLLEGCSEEVYQRMEDIFVMCSRFELDFWEMAWRLEH